MGGWLGVGAYFFWWPWFYCDGVFLWFFCFAVMELVAHFRCVLFLLFLLWWYWWGVLFGCLFCFFVASGDLDGGVCSVAALMLISVRYLWCSNTIATSGGRRMKELTDGSRQAALPTTAGGVGKSWQQCRCEIIVFFSRVRERRRLRPVTPLTVYLVCLCR